MDANDTIRGLAQRAAEECLGFSIRRAARAVGRLYDDAFAPLGIKGTQFSLLNAIMLLQQPAIGQLAQALVMDRTTLTRNLKPLQQDGLVESLPGEDRRGRRVKLTPTGRALLRRALPVWSETQAELVKRLGQDRARHLSLELGELTGHAQTV